ncbi:MAG: hypothetical protein A3C88_01960 [Candidatus Yanofskybacteria bacterium RIFCSPHIGHO2_02_FULL_50_12]|uniref:Uncharacterized protein n=1 Tax=Candidatus Yanofskybacteria bacterium RIFCSPHIGHO2_02_FULL_50_12 TaxID=1802685 RepID=A0A1F8FXH5_9BACT|nr:MAG: hypothetical protein A3C88_01960 [Candidatus Yanofskybacteria bacterium RIFCSPHIGHO2_02_FULL_50_12]
MASQVLKEREFWNKIRGLRHDHRLFEAVAHALTTIDMAFRRVRKDRSKQGTVLTAIAIDVPDEFNTSTLGIYEKLEIVIRRSGGHIQPKMELLRPGAGWLLRLRAEVAFNGMDLAKFQRESAKVRKRLQEEREFTRKQPPPVRRHSRGGFLRYGDEESSIGD